MIDYQNSHEIQRITNPLLLGFLLKQKILALKNHAGFMRYFKNSAWMLGEQILRMIAGLLVGVWVARYLGPEQFGTFSYVMTLSVFFASVAKLGLDNIVIREIVNHPDKQDTYLSTAFWLKILSSLIVIILIILVLPWTKNDETTSLYILIVISGLIFQSFEVIDFYFQSQVLAKFVSICKIIQLSLSSLVKIYLVFTESELVWFIVVTLFDQFSLAISLAIAYQYNKSKKLPLLHFNLAIAKGLIRNSWPLMLSGIVVILYMKIDQIIIKNLLGEYQLGIYSAATRIVEVLYFIPTIISNSIFPSLAKSKLNPLEYEKKIKNLYGIITIIMIIAAMLTTILAKEIILVLYGDLYINSSTILSIYVWNGVFIGLFVSSGKWFIIENLTILALYRNTIAATASILLNIILIKKYGLNGSAISTLLSFFISSIMFDLLFKKTRSQFFIKIKSFLFFTKIHKISF